ncbi:MAG: ATPase, partial [Paenibacillaceae bacterium]|nr:ATPase [Paenibacillaceae bacterium]
LANPQAMPTAVSAMDAYHKIGWPESQYIIAQAILFAVESPKSNSIATAISRAIMAMDGHGRIEVPLHLRDTHYRGAEKLGHTGYMYPHDFPNHYVEQQYLPTALAGMTFYEPTEQGAEEKLRANRMRRQSAARANGEG